MKIFLRLPNGTEFHYEHEPMDDVRFYMLLGVVAFFGFLLWVAA